ncbi:hypothetical protein [Vibrio alginolyticus]|nr:hypothetical protein [Vibrio alginolyticus]
MKRIWSLFMRVLLALNMFVLHLLTGQPDLTIGDCNLRKALR